MSAIIKALKILVLVAILAPAVLWLDQTFGPGYTQSMQQQILADLNAKEDSNSDTTPADKQPTTATIEQAENSEQAALDKKEDNKKVDGTAKPPEKVSTDTITNTIPQTKTETKAQTKDKKLQGIDISHFQGNINWQAFTKNQFEFVFVKATGGETFIDPKFSSNWHALRTTNLARGAYHFFYASDDAKKQAEHFLTTIGKLKPTDLPPVLDVEITDHSDAQTILNGVLTWLETIEDETERLPIIYSGISFAKQYLTDERLSKYPLWIADYNKTLPPLPEPWQKQGWQFWQYTETGHALGINGNVDHSYFSGNKDDLSSFIESTNIK